MKQARIFKITKNINMVLKDLYYNKKVQLQPTYIDNIVNTAVSYLNSRNIKVETICNTKEAIYFTTYNFIDKIIE